MAKHRLSPAQRLTREQRARIRDLRVSADLGREDAQEALVRVDEIMERANSAELDLFLFRRSALGERYYVIVERDGGLGSYGEPENSPLRRFSVVYGADRGNGFQGYQSVTHALNTLGPTPRSGLRKFLHAMGYSEWLAQHDAAVAMATRGSVHD